MTPCIWVLKGDKVGDNAQITAIEEALDCPCEQRYIHIPEPYATAKPKVRAAIYHIDPERSDALSPPWPDLVITTGRRLAMVALWIKEQSGGHSKIVLVGRTSGRLERYDLIIASREKQLPPLPNVLPIQLPLMQVKPTAIAAAKTEWQSQLAALPRPLIGILIGGPTSTFQFNQQTTQRLLELTTTIQAQGGTAYLSTSRRTPTSVADQLQQQLPAGAQLFRWAPTNSQNPYLGLLAFADGFIVTGDSLSMLTEVAKAGRPLAILPLPVSSFGMIDQWRRSLTNWFFSPADEQHPKPIRHLIALLLYRARLLTQTRDFTAIHQLLFDLQLAVPAGEPLHPPTGTIPDDLSKVIARIKQLI